jgi:DNA-directed RNA polymerase specialized sigma subunit
LNNLKNKRKIFSVDIEIANGLIDKLTETKEMLIYANIGLIFHCINYKSILAQDRSNLDDFVSEGLMCLNDCVEKFNSEKGFKFSSYACNSILRRLFNFKRTKLKDSGHMKIKSLPHGSFERLLEDKNDRESYNHSDYVIEKIDFEEKCKKLYGILESNSANLTNVEKHFIDFCIFGENKKVDFAKKNKITKRQREIIQDSSIGKLREAWV